MMLEAEPGLSNRKLQAIFNRYKLSNTKFKILRDHKTSAWLLQDQPQNHLNNS